jgi:hypothetical protein
MQGANKVDAGCGQNLRNDDHPDFDVTLGDKLRDDVSIRPDSS